MIAELLFLFPTLDDPRLSDTMDDLRKFEGYSESVYLDHLGHPTIGFGHRCSLNPLSIDREQADVLLAEDVQTAAIAAARVIPDLGSHPVPVRQAMLHMAFQMGATGLFKFAKMRKALANRDYTRAAAEALASRWAAQTPHRARKIASLITQGTLP